MTIANWLTLAGLLIVPAVSVYIAWAQRRQMRQIELYREDKSVGLKPPPHRIIVFLRNHSMLFWGVFSAVALVYDMHGQGPVTRETVFWIVLDILLITMAVLGDFIAAITRKMSPFMASYIAVLEKVWGSPPKTKPPQ